MSAHTPGPWEFVAKLSASENHKGYFVRAEKAAKNGKWALAEVQPGDEDGSLGEANARLIAAAPDMLAMLQDILSFLRTSGYDTRLVRATIARATTPTTPNGGSND